MVVAQIDADTPGVDAVVTDFVAAVTAGTSVQPIVNSRRTAPWVHKASWPGSGESGNGDTRRYKNKAGYLRRSMTDKQIAAVYRNLTNSTGGEGSGMMLLGYVGRVNTVSPDATAVPQRDSVMKVVYQTVWADEADDAANLSWIRTFYRDVYADTGGVPVPNDVNDVNDVNDGSYINYPDTDLADPAWNTSGVAARTLYYKGNYPRLQRVKARWDPRGVFRHALSVEPPEL